MNGTAEKGKPIGDRIKEVRTLYEQLDSYGITDRFEGVVEFKRIANEFVKNGHGASGKIPLEGIDRTLEYVLTTNALGTCTAVLRYTGVVKMARRRR